MAAWMLRSLFGMSGESRAATSQRRHRNRRRDHLTPEPLEHRAMMAIIAPTYTVMQDWGTGFEAGIELANLDATSVSNWTVTFDYAAEITSIWNATIVARHGGQYTIEHAGWNAMLEAGRSVAFGFIGSGNHAAPTNYQLNGTPLAGMPSDPVLDDPVPTAPESGTPVPTTPANPDGDLTATFHVVTDWGSGFTGEVNVRNATSVALEGWTVSFNFSGEIDTVWNGEIIGHSGTTYTVRGAHWNDGIAAGQSVAFGFNASPGGVAATLTNFLITGVQNGPQPVAPAPTPPTLEPPTQTPTPEPAPAPVTLSVIGERVVEGSLGESFVRGPLATAGSQIVDALGQTVRIAGVNWFGLETSNFAPHGLWARGYREMMDQMKLLGFNTIRLPYSDQLLESDSRANGIDFLKNPDLQGLSGLDVMDRIIDYADAIGLWVILDHHRSDAGAGPNASGLWYTADYPEQVWIDNLTFLAGRYADTDAVVGIDLHNEPHGPATWGDGSIHDWRLAAERAGNAVLGANSRLLIIVEGIETTSTGGYWWGGNLSNAGQFPVRLTMGDRLVYSPHDYPASVFPQEYFSDPDYPDNLPDIWNANWGYLFRDGIAPVMLGEFGSRLETSIDRDWFSALTMYLGGDLDGDGTDDLAAGDQGISWTYWSWNPNSGDTGGILADDWLTPIDEKVASLSGIQFPRESLGDPAASGTATFTISLSDPSSQLVTVSYGTIDGSALAGSDYAPQAGTVVFAPGETVKLVNVRIVPDTLVEADESFALQLLNPIGAGLGTAVAVATIENDDPAPPPASSDPVDATGRVFTANPTAGDIVGFDPTVDRLDFGDTSVHNLIVGKMPTGEVAIVNPWAWTPEYQLIAGIGFDDLRVENYGIVGNEHLRQDLGGVISWELGIGPRDEGTVYVRSHEYGLHERIENFDPSVNRLSFLYFGTRERLSVTDTPEGLLISVQPTDQSLLLVGVAKSALVPGNIEFHHDQIVEDQLEIPFGFTVEQLTMVSRAALLTPLAPMGAITDGSQTSPGSTNPHDGHDHGTMPMDPMPMDPPPVPPTSEPTPSDPQTLPIAEHDGVLAAYFPEWGIYGRNYRLADVPGDQLTHLIYAFANLTAAGEMTLFDSYAAIEKRFSADESVSGEADLWYYPPDDPRSAQTIWGNFNQLALLKEKYPHLRISIAVGGWTLSDHFSTVTSTEAGREAFAASIVEFLTTYQVFDGIDFDWEYPGGGGESGNSASPEDGVNYALLLADVRAHLDDLGSRLGRSYEISVASPAGLDKIATFNLPGLAPSVDFFNVMTYDFHGTWEDTTGHQSAFLGDPNGYDIRTAVQAYLDAGVPAAQIVLGAPLYTRAWSGVADGGDGGYDEPASGAAPGTYEAGNYDYKDLLGQINAGIGWEIYWDDNAQAAYVYNAELDIFSSFETTTSIALKAEWAEAMGLGGMMFWDLSNDAIGSRDSLVEAAFRSLVLGDDLAEIAATSSLPEPIVIGGDGAIGPLPLS
jgi:endoglucanase